MCALQFVLNSNPLRPCHSCANRRQLGFYVGGDAGMEFAVVVQRPQGVFAHLLTRKEFWGDVSKVEAQLHTFAMDLRSEFVVRPSPVAAPAKGVAPTEREYGVSLLACSTPHRPRRTQASVAAPAKAWSASPAAARFTRDKKMRSKKREPAFSVLHF